MTKPSISERRLSLIGGLLVSLGPISMSLYTPALPELVRVFSTDVATVKLTLTTYFAGFAFSQLVCGPVSDAFGRRKTAFAFTFVYLVGSVIAASAPSVEWLLAARLVQGIGAAAGISIARAMVRDLYTGDASVRIMNMIGVLLAIGPAASPTIGGIALDLFGWQSLFAFMVIYGAALTVVLLVLTPETLRNPDSSHLRPRRLLRNYGRLIASPAVLGPSIVLGCTSGAIYTMATLLPFVMIEEVKLTPTLFGFAMIMQSGSYLVGAILMRPLLRRFEAHRMVPFGFLMMAVAGVFFAAILWAIEPSLLGVMGPVALFAFGFAFISPSMQTAGLAHFSDIAGSAAALMGFCQMGGGFLGSAIAAATGDPVFSIATIIPAMIVIAVATHYSLRAIAGPQQMLDSVADRIVKPHAPAE